MTLKNTQGKDAVEKWTVFDDNGNVLYLGDLETAQAYYDANRDLTIEDAYVVDKLIVNRLREKKGDLLEAKATFHAKSLDTVVLGDAIAPSIMTGIQFIGAFRGFEIDVATQSFKNISGRPLQMTGALAIQVLHGGAQAVELYVYSESSIDGISWVKNDNSLRKNTITKEGVDYRTISAFTDAPWQDGTYIRFRFAREGAGTLTLAPTSETLDGELIEGHSYNLILTERE